MVCPTCALLKIHFNYLEVVYSISECQDDNDNNYVHYNVPLVIQLVH